MSQLFVESCPDPNLGAVPQKFGPGTGSFEEVESVIDHWPGEGHHYFRVRVRDGAEFILRHDLKQDAWGVHFVLIRKGVGRPVELGAEPSVA